MNGDSNLTHSVRASNKEDTQRTTTLTDNKKRDYENVKSIPPTTENWLRKLYKYSMNINMSTEDKHETNHINNKCNDMNMNTRKMHNI